MKKTAKYVIASILISMAAHFRWFTGFAVLAEGDWNVRFPESVLHMLALPEAWQPWGLGNLSLTTPFYLMDFVHAALTKFGLTFGPIERIEYLWPVVILTPLGGFLLIKKITRSDFAAFIASLAWSFNTYFLSTQEQHFYIMLANALIPFAVLAFESCMRRRRPTDIFLTTLALFAITVADFRLFYILCFILAGWVIFDFLVDRGWRTPKKIPAIAFYAAMPVVLTLLLNSYWIIGFVSSGSLFSNSILNRSIFADYLKTTTASFALTDGGWTDTTPIEFGTNPVIWHMWWLPFAAMAGLWARRRDKDALFFGLVALLGIFLGKQSAAPFVGAYRWLFAHFPGFNAFRESSKFFVITALGYSMLVGYLVLWLESLPRTVAEHGDKIRNFFKKARVPIYAALIFFPLWNTIPLLTGDFGQTFVPIFQRPEYSAFNDFLRSRPDFFRTLWIPAISQWSESSPLHPMLGAPTFQDAMHADDSFGAITKIFTLQDTANYLDLMSIRYVVVPLQYPAGHDDLFAEYGIPRVSVVKALDAVSYLKRVNLGTGDMLAYENVNARPHFYVTDVPEDLSSPVPFRAVEDRTVDISRRELTIKGITGPFFLHFTETFDPGWKLFAKQPGRLTALDGIRHDIAGITHSQDAAGTNVYRIDPAKACAVLDCVHEADGTTAIRVSLFFTPQAWFDFGDAVTAAVFLACLVSLAVVLRRGRRIKSKK